MAKNKFPEPVTTLVRDLHIRSFPFIERGEKSKRRKRKVREDEKHPDWEKETRHAVEQLVENWKHSDTELDVYLDRVLAKAVGRGGKHPKYEISELRRRVSDLNRRCDLLEMKLAENT